MTPERFREWVFGGGIGDGYPLKYHGEKENVRRLRCYWTAPASNGPCHPFVSAAGHFCAVRFLRCGLRTRLIVLKPRARWLAR